MSAYSTSHVKEAFVLGERKNVYVHNLKSRDSQAHTAIPGDRTNEGE